MDIRISFSIPDKAGKKTVKNIPREFRLFSDQGGSGSGSGSGDGETHKICFFPRVFIVFLCLPNSLFIFYFAFVFLYI